MKIDFIISALHGGGAERVLALIANNFANKPEYKITVITLLDVKDKYELNKAINRVKLKKTSLIPSHTLRSIINLSRYYRFSANRPDIIISFITLTNLITIIVAKLFSIKIIAQEHNSYLRHMDNRKIITAFTKKHVYKFADALTVLTSFDISFYKKYGSNVYVMPNPCSFQPIIENSHIRKKTILAVGNLDRFHHKGFDNLIKLISPIIQDHPDWQLKIAGSGDDGLKLLTKLAEDNNTTEKIIFTGFVDNLSEIMFQSSIFILPSRFEGLPMVLLEAMSQGMACIAFDCKTGPSDIIKHNKNGLLIDDQNMIEMQNGLRLLMKNEELRYRLSNQGISSIDKYHIETVSKRYMALFNKIIKEK